MELFEGVCSSLTSIKTVVFSTGDSAFYLDNINSQNEYYLKVYQNSATNGHFGVFYTSASTPPNGLLCPITDCNLVHNGDFETLSSLVVAATQAPNYVYAMTDNTLPNDNVCGWIKGGNASPLLYGSSTGPNHSVLISCGYWTPPYGGTASTIYTEINNGTPLTQGESYLLT